MVIEPVEQQPQGLGLIDGDAEQHGELAQLHQRHRHTAEEHHHGDALHAAVVQLNTPLQTVSWVTLPSRFNCMIGRKFAGK